MAWVLKCINYFVQFCNSYPYNYLMIFLFPCSGAKVIRYNSDKINGMKDDDNAKMNMLVAENLQKLVILFYHLAICK